LSGLSAKGTGPMTVLSVGRLFSLVSLLCLAQLVCRADTVILTENFDALTPQLGVTSAGAFHTISGTNVDIVGDGLFGFLCHPPESGNCIDLDGTGGDPQGILQTVKAITLLPGVGYLLSFDLIGSQRGNTTSTTVTFGPYDQTFTLSSNDDTTGIVTDALVTVSSPTQAFLTFTSNTPGQVGAVLDNVTVTTTPEPGTLTLIFPGMLVLLGWSKRGLRIR
jgi:hypothetical protein